LILNGDYFLGSVLATTVTKLALRFSELEEDPTLVNAKRAEVGYFGIFTVPKGLSEF
jgi:coatomer subunit beta